MKDDEAQKIAERIQILSFSILSTATYIEAISGAIKISQKQLKASADSLKALVDTLPKEVQERLYHTNSQELEDEQDESIIDLIRRFLKGGN